MLRPAIAFLAAVLALSTSTVFALRHVHHPRIHRTRAAAPVAPKAAPRAASGVQVWVNTRSHVYHLPGSRWYGATKNGQYMPENQAIREGDRRSERG